MNTAATAAAAVTATKADAHGASVQGMQAYYAQRAAMYERVYHKPERQADLRAMEAALAPLFAGRRVLELACGTGWWTPHGASQAQRWLATDINPETMALARQKRLPGCVQFASLDAYTWQGLPALAPAQAQAQRQGQAPMHAAALQGAPSRQTPFDGGFDAAFAGCWWSHVPLARLQPWLAALHERLLPGARVVFLDNRFVQTSSTPISRRDDQGNTYQQRLLDDGSAHEVLKNFPTPAQAFAVLGPRAHSANWMAYTHYWVLSYLLK
jgi:SAM-dependent methyltransferase